jgi:hypothetical protein
MAPRFLLALALLAPAAACSRQPASGFTGDQTRQYLIAVGRVRKVINNDNRERMPALIRGQDLEMLGDEANRIEKDKQDLLKLPAAGVDPGAVEFVRHFLAILDAYKAVCVDTGELLREVIRDDAANGGPSPLMPAIKSGLQIVQPDTISTVGSLVDRLDQLDAAAKEHAVFLNPIAARVREDRDKLAAAKQAEHAFTAKAKLDLAARYPDIDWTSRELLP